MAITFEREQQATIQAYHRNRHDPRIKDLGVDTVLDMVRIFRIRKTFFNVFLVEQDTTKVEHPKFAIQSIIWGVLDPNMELLAVKLEKKPSGMASLSQPWKTYGLQQRRAAEGHITVFAEGAQKVPFG